jgi:S1-C subfamily serine protease
VPVKKVSLGIIRDGDSETFDVVLGEATESKTKAAHLHEGLSGAELTNTTDSDPIEGVKVTNVEKGSKAEAYQLQAGDIIVGINKVRVRNLAELRAILEQKPGILAINIQRGDRSIYLVVR